MPDGCHAEVSDHSDDTLETLVHLGFEPLHVAFEPVHSGTEPVFHIVVGYRVCVLYPAGAAGCLAHDLSCGRTTRKGRNNRLRTWSSVRPGISTSSWSSASAGS